MTPRSPSKPPAHDHKIARPPTTSRSSHSTSQRSGTHYCHRFRSRCCPLTPPHLLTRKHTTSLAAHSRPLAATTLPLTLPLLLLLLTLLLPRPTFQLRPSFVHPPSVYSPDLQFVYLSVNPSIISVSPSVRHSFRQPVHPSVRQVPSSVHCLSCLSVHCPSRLSVNCLSFNCPSVRQPSVRPSTVCLSINHPSINRLSVRQRSEKYIEFWEKSRAPPDTQWRHLGCCLRLKPNRNIVK